ncbi:hypothetical protein L3V83_06585 [Thiotrichales bacterium 19X7-9]|nr:hypothetical protein [Thiotrichales bacterium 19X7-9]
MSITQYNNISFYQTHRHINQDHLTSQDLYNLGCAYLTEFGNEASLLHSNQSIARNLMKYAQKHPDASHEECLEKLLRVLKNDLKQDGCFMHEITKALNKALNTDIQSRRIVGRNYEPKEPDTICRQFTSAIQKQYSDVANHLKITFEQTVNEVEKDNLCAKDLKNLGQAYINKFGCEAGILHSHQDIARNLIQFAEDKPNASHNQCVAKLFNILNKDIEKSGTLIHCTSDVLNKALGTDIQKTMIAVDSIFTTKKSKSPSQIHFDFQQQLSIKQQAQSFDLDQ